MNSRRDQLMFSDKVRPCRGKVGPLEVFHHDWITNFARLILPRLQTSNGCKGCSPHTFVDSIGPKDFKTGLNRLTASKNTIPGSPVAWAREIISFHKDRAGIFWTIDLSRGFFNAQSFPFFTAFMNRSKAPTEILKLLISPSTDFARINSKISG